MPRQIELDDIIRSQKVELELVFKYPDGSGNKIILNGHSDQVREELDNQFVGEILNKIYGRPKMEKEGG